jgi:putative lipoprotein
MSRVLFALLAASAFAACASSGAPAPGLEGTSWRLEDLAGESVGGDGPEGTLEFPEAGKVAGRAFCNRYFGKVEISGSSIKLGPIGSTKMACEEPAMARESRFLAALEKAERFTLDGTTLLISFSGSEKPLRFTRKPA